VLILLATLAAGGLALWLHLLSPWRRRDEEAKQRQIASQLPALLEKSMVQRLLDDESPPPEPTRLAVQKIAQLARQGRAAAAELTSFLTFKCHPPADEAYVRWRAASALQQLGIALPLDPLKLFRADLYLQSKTIAWRDEATAELTSIAGAALKATMAPAPQQPAGHLQRPQHRDGTPQQPSASLPSSGSAPKDVRGVQQAKPPAEGRTQSASDAIRFSCPHCGKPIVAPSGSAGKQAKCPKCKMSLAIPAPAHEQHRSKGTAS
jgi:hypothetical protein